MTQGSVPAAWQPPPPITGADIIIAAPPALATASSPGLLVRLLPVIMSIATLAVMAVVFVSGSGMTRNPAFLAFPIVIVISMALTLVSSRGVRQGRGIGTDRADYLGYLNRLRETVIEVAAAQHVS